MTLLGLVRYISNKKVFHPNVTVTMSDQEIMTPKWKKEQEERTGRIIKYSEILEVYAIWSALIKANKKKNFPWWIRSWYLITRRRLFYLKSIFNYIEPVHPIGKSIQITLCYNTNYISPPPEPIIVTPDEAKKIMEQD